MERKREWDTECVISHDHIEWWCRLEGLNGLLLHLFSMFNDNIEQENVIKWTLISLWFISVTSRLALTLQ